VAARVDIETIDDLSFTTLNLKEEPFWMAVDYMLFPGLEMTGTGEVTTKADNKALLDSPVLYIPVVKGICERWGINLVWSVPSFAEDEYVCKELLCKPAVVSIFWETLHEHIEKHGIAALEFDVHTLAALLLHSRDPEEQLRKLPCSIWLSISNEADPLPDNKMTALMELLGTRMSRFIVKCYGFFDIRKLPTSKGAYRTMNLNTDNTLTSFDSMVNYLCRWTTADKILMEMSTGGIEYQVSKTDKAMVDKYRYVTLSSIRHRLRFGKQRYTEYYDHHNETSMIHFPNDDLWICYDNAQVRVNKLRYIRMHALAGVVVGPLQDDCAPNHADSLLKTVTQYL
jgi:hypothetical protein